MSGRLLLLLPSLLFTCLMFCSVSVLGSDLETRLVGGPFDNEGRLEVRPPGKQWGTFCFHNGTDTHDLRALACDMCRSLGYLGAYSASIDQHYGLSDGFIWYRGGLCNCVYELCRISSWDLSEKSCDHRTDINTRCLSDDLYLVGGNNNRSGWIEMAMEGGRRVTVIQSVPYFIEDADMACMHFGYPLAISMLTNHPVIDPDVMTLTKGHCRSTDKTLTDCLRQSLCGRGSMCSLPGGDFLYKSRFGMECAEGKDVVPWNETIPGEMELRLFNTDNTSEDGNKLSGRVQVRRGNSSWGDACFRDAGQNDAVARAVCHRYGSPYVLSSYSQPAAQAATSVQYLLRVDRTRRTYWVRVVDYCMINDLNYLAVECLKGVTLYGTTVFLPMHHTCQGRCGVPPANTNFPSTTMSCGCDDLCHLFKDCCYDVVSACPTNDETTVQPAGVSLLTTSTEFYSCTYMMEERASYQLVSRCPESWNDSIIRDHCEGVPFAQPILYPVEGRAPIAFKSAMCAHCHGFHAYVFNRIEIPIDAPHFIDIQPVTIDTDTSVNSSEVLPAEESPPQPPILELEPIVLTEKLGPQYNPVESTGTYNLRACNDPFSDGIVGECPTENVDNGLQEACDAYSATVSVRGDQRTFKNPHCAICHGFDLEDIVLFTTINVPAYYHPTTDDSVLEAVLLGPMFEEQIPLTFTVELGREIECSYSKEFVVRTRADPHTVGSSPKSLDAFVATKCLINAVAFADITVVRDFRWSLEALQESISGSNETENIARVPVYGFAQSKANRFEVNLDGVLFGRDDIANGGTAWKTQCRVDEVYLSDECSIVQSENQTDNECLDTLSNVTSVIVNGTMYLYIDDVGLIEPTNISFVTAYETSSETGDFVKRKFTRLCGNRPSDLTCEASNGGETGQSSSAILNDQPNATLSNGDILVCSSTSEQNIYLDPFTGADHVVNVVCLVLSLLGLLGTIVTYCVFPVLRNLHGLAVMSMSVSIFVTQLLFLFALDKTSNANACVAIAIIAHYSCLAAFAWMTLLAWDLMRTFTSSVVVRSAEGADKYCAFGRMSLFGWGSPLLVLIPSLVINFCDDCTSVQFKYGDVATKICWISQNTAVLVSFGVPVLICICLNVFFFALTVRGIRLSKKASSLVNQTKSKKKEAMQEFFIYIKISSAVGLTWLFGFVALLTKLTVFWYLFIIIASLQGVFIFAAFAFNRRVRRMWAAKLCGARKKDAGSSSCTHSTTSNRASAEKTLSNATNSSV